MPQAEYSQRMYDLDTNALLCRVLYKPQHNLLARADDKFWLWRMEILRVFDSIYLITAHSLGSIC